MGKLPQRLGRHPYRPGPVHFMLGAPGHRPLTTHLFVPDDPYLGSDAVFGVKESLIGAFVHRDGAARAEEPGLDSPFWTLQRDFARVSA